MLACEGAKLTQQLAEVLAALAVGKEVILTRTGAPFAKLVKLDHAPQGRVPDSAAGLI